MGKPFADTLQYFSTLDYLKGTHVWKSELLELIKRLSHVSFETVHAPVLNVSKLTPWSIFSQYVFRLQLFTCNGPESFFCLRRPAPDQDRSAEWCLWRFLKLCDTFFLWPRGENVLSRTTQRGENSRQTGRVCGERGDVIVCPALVTINGEDVTSPTINRGWTSPSY